MDNLISTLQAQSWTSQQVIAAVAGLLAIGCLAVIARFFGLWLRACLSNAGVSILDMIGMRLRKVDAGTVVRAKIELVKAGIHHITVDDLENHYLIGGRVLDTTRAIVEARRTGADVDWTEVCVADLRDVQQPART